MKLSKYLEDHSSTLSKHERLDGLINFFDFMSKSTSDTGRAPTIGVEALVNNWIRQQFAYREQMMEDLITISRTVAEVAAPVLHIKNEVFRRGISWEPAFSKQCKECGKAYETIVETCTKCGSEKFIDPDEEQLVVLKKFLADCNVFDNSLEEILKQFHESLNTIDDAFLYISKEYKWDATKKRILSKPMEIRNLRGSAVEFELDDSGLPKHSHWVCVFHRESPPETIPGNCKECAKEGREVEMKPAMYRFRHRGNFFYLLDSEVCHVSKFYPSETYGYSPVLVLFEKCLTLLGMDKTLFRYFFERKMPASMLMVATDDPQGVARAKNEILAQMRANPDHVPMIGYSNTKNRGKVDLVRLFHTLQEMDYLPVRSEIRERVASIWGLPPLWQSDYTGMGGLSGQSQQMLQFSRIVEADQRIFNGKVFPFILEAFGITDWKLILQQPEEKAEATRIQFAQQRVMIASSLSQMGFTIELQPGVNSLDEIDFKISGEATKQNAGGGGGYSEGGDEGGFGQDPEQDPGQDQNDATQFSFSKSNWTEQLLKKGVSISSIGDVQVHQNGLTTMLFVDKAQNMVAVFSPLGALVDVYKYMPIVKGKSLKAPIVKTSIDPEDMEDEDVN